MMDFDAIAKELALSCGGDAIQVDRSYHHCLHALREAYVAGMHDAAHVVGTGSKSDFRASSPGSVNDATHWMPLPATPNGG